MRFPLRRFRKIAGGLAVTGALIAGLTGFGVASASTGAGAVHPDAKISTVYEQAAYNQDVPITASGPGSYTFVNTSPVLPEGSYLVNSVISFNNLTTGSQVLCGWTTTPGLPNGDDLYGNYGDVENEDPTAGNGSCTVTGTATINNTKDHLMLWADVYSGSAGPVANSWSMNETPVTNVVVSSLT
jgi:hypothetical protein